MKDFATKSSIMQFYKFKHFFFKLLWKYQNLLVITNKKYSGPINGNDYVIGAHFGSAGFYTFKESRKHHWPV